MRAKEFIASNETSLKHPEEVKQIINELLPLRSCKQKTVEYYNKKLISDIRLQGCLLAKELYEKNNAMQADEPEGFLLGSDEIPVENAAAVRDELFEVIKDDKTFGYLFFLLGNLRNSQRPTHPIDCVPDEKGILDALKQSRDDYPKSALSEYLDDDINFAQYRKLTDAGITDEATILDWFNNAYHIYDEIRLVKANPLSAIRIYDEDNSCGSDEAKALTFRFICTLIESTASDDKRLIRIKEELKRVLPSTDNGNAAATSKFHLKQKKGRKTDFARVMNVLLEMGFFVDSDGDQAVKADFFDALGVLLNENFKDYQNLLSTTKGTSVADQKALTRVFEEMLAKQKEIISK